MQAKYMKLSEQLYLINCYHWFCTDIVSVRTTVNRVTEKLRNLPRALTGLVISVQ